MRILVGDRWMAGHRRVRLASGRQTDRFEDRTVGAWLGVEVNSRYVQ